ncbi:MAG: hypothetical protein KDK39_03405 [Leptospiraceae bacterium]|nr:hypothetical protein [Leptospiraceae bacterium]
MNLAGIDEATLMQTWKGGPSAEEGYHRAYTTSTYEGDQLQVDFNYPRQMARISLKLAAEGMREYVAVIKSGTILQERESVGRRSMDLQHKFQPHLPWLALLPDSALLEVIGGNYGIPTQSAFANRSGYGPALPVYPGREPFSLLQVFKKYLQQKREREEKARGWLRKLWRRLPGEAFDLGLGGLLIWLFSHGYINLTELAGYSGSLGVFCGAWDWLWRQRDPFLPKVMALAGLSAWAVYWQVQNRMWAIFL